MKCKWMLITGLILGFPFLAGSDEQPLPFFTGEKITYAISKLGMKAGEATLTFSGHENVDNQDTYLIIFRAKAFNFFDEEKIYIDPHSFLPVRVDRDLNIFGKKEKIVEKYQPQEGKVVVTKTAGDKISEQVIEKKGKLDNIYSFIYRSRLKENFNIGDQFKLYLPTQDVAISLVEKNTLKAAGKTFDTYFMQSDPKKYRVWFDTSAKRIPLRIDGAVGFGDTSMILEGYQ